MKKNLKRALCLLISLLLFSPPGLSASADVAPPQPQAAQPAISMDFQDASLKDIIKAFSLQSGLNFVASEAVQDRKVTLYLDKVPLDKAMEKIFKANNLSYDLDKEANIFVVKDWGKVQVETSTRVFFLKHATVSGSPINSEKQQQLGSDTSMGETSAATGSSGSGGATSAGGSAGGSDSGGKASISNVVRGLLSADGSLIEDYRTNSLIVSDTPSRLENISRVIAALDVPVPQIMLEVEMLDVSKNTIERLGIKYASSMTSPMFTTIFKGAILSSALPVASNIYAARALTKTITPGSLDFFNTNSYTAAVDFIKQQADTKILARPRILTLNNEVAEIKITTNEAIGSITATQGQGSASSSGTSAERVETGVNLRVTPQVNPDTGEITMFIVPRVRDASASTFDPSRYKDPEERTAKTLVRIKDGDTVAIGGLIRSDRSETITKLPILGDLPWIGGAFRHKYKDKDKGRELLVFITPRIMREEAKDVQLAQAKKIVIPEREQIAPTLSAGRKAMIKQSIDALQREQR